MSINVEPYFLFQFEPILTDGDPSVLGQQLILNFNGVKTPVDNIQLGVSGTEHTLSISYGGNDVITVDDVYLTEFMVSNYVIKEDGVSEATIELTATNNTQNGYDLNSPLCDLFRVGDIVRITMGTTLASRYENSSNVNLFVGAINNIRITYDSNNLLISIKVEDLLNILSRSASVQTSTDQNSDQIFLQPITAQTYNFNDLLNKLLNETIISETVTSVKYYKGMTNNKVEVNAVGKSQGTAICKDSNIYVYTDPTASKLDVILQTLYAYQRVFYVDNGGNFIITPLQTYFDKKANWSLQIGGNIGAQRILQGAVSADIDNIYIPSSAIEIDKNTPNIQNRVFLSLISILSQFNQSNATGSNNKTNAYSIATVNNPIYPRVSEFVLSEKYLQTFFGTQELNLNIIKNSGLLNIVQNIRNVQGLKTIIKTDDNSNYISNSNKDVDPLKYFVKLYAAKALAEQLFNDMHITITIPTNLTYNQTNKSFRQIPLNQMISLPSVTNNVFDNQTQAFCYGYTLKYDISNGSMTTLHLTKPYSYTCLWADQIVEIT